MVVLPHIMPCSTPYIFAGPPSMGKQRVYTLMPSSQKSFQQWNHMHSRRRKGYLFIYLFFNVVPWNTIWDEYLALKSLCFLAVYYICFLLSYITRIKCIFQILWVEKGWLKKATLLHSSEGWTTSCFCCSFWFMGKFWR